MAKTEDKKTKPSLEDAHQELLKQLEDKKKNDRLNFNVDMQKLAVQYKCVITGVPEYYQNDKGEWLTRIKIIIQNKE